MILFSIPVHEEPKVIINQVENFKHYNPECAIVLHVSLSMPEADYAELKTLLQSYPFVYLNPKRLISGYADGTQFKMHVENMKFAMEQGIPFDYFCLHASNDMFVRHGLAGYIAPYDGGSNLLEEKHYADWNQYHAAQRDKKYLALLKKHKLHISGGQVEGSFYKKEVIQKALGRFNQLKYEWGKLYAHGYSPATTLVNKKPKLRAVIARLSGANFYAKEELYFPSLTFDLIAKRLNWNYCYINWAKKLQITIGDIENIRSRNYRALETVLNIEPGKHEYFAVKRIERKLDDKIRQYITRTP